MYSLMSVKPLSHFYAAEEERWWLFTSDEHKKEFTKRKRRQKKYVLIQPGNENADSAFNELIVC